MNELASAENGVVMFSSSTGREVSVEDPVVAGVGSRKASFCRPELRDSARHLRGEWMLRHASLTAQL